MGLLTMVYLGHVCFCFFGSLGVSASGHGFVSGWLGGAGDGGIWRWWVCGGGEVLSVSMLPFAWNIGEFF